MTITVRRKKRVEMENLFDGVDIPGGETGRGWEVTGGVSIVL